MKIENKNLAKQLNIVWVPQKMSDELWKMSDENLLNQNTPLVVKVILFKKKLSESTQISDKRCPQCGMKTPVSTSLIDVGKWNLVWSSSNLV